MIRGRSQINITRQDATSWGRSQIKYNPGKKKRRKREERCYRSNLDKRRRFRYARQSNPIVKNRESHKLQILRIKELWEAGEAETRPERKRKHNLSTSLSHEGHRRTTYIGRIKSMKCREGSYLASEAAQRYRSANKRMAE